MAITASFISPNCRTSRLLVDSDIDMADDFTSGVQRRVIVDEVTPHGS